MMKRVLIVAVILFCFLTSVFSSSDISLFWGPAVMDVSQKGVSFSYGVNVGITPRLEGAIWAMSHLTPKPFSDNILALEAQFALMGVRSNYSRVAGSGINAFLGAGTIFSSDNPHNLFLPSEIFVSITPLSLGNPILERREKLAKIMVSYNWFTNDVKFLFNIVLFDYYIKGTWRDYR